MVVVVDVRKLNTKRTTHLAGLISRASWDGGAVRNVPREGEIVELHARRRRLLLFSELLTESSETAIAFVRRCRRTAKCSATATAVAAAASELLQNSPPVPAGTTTCADGDRHP